MGKSKTSKVLPTSRINIKNKRAEHDYLVIDKYTAGIVLTGTEIKKLKCPKNITKKLERELKKYGQEHLLSNYEKLSNEDKNRLLNDILTIDFGEISKLYEQTKQ